MNALKERPPVPPAVGILVAVAAVSFSSIFIKWCQAEPAVIGMWRLWFAVVLLAPWWLRDLPRFTRLARRHLLLVLLAGISLGVHFWLWTASLFYTSVASSTILLALQPFFVLLGERWFWGTTQRGTSWLSVTLAVAGVVLITGGDVRVAGSALFGDVLAAASTVAVSAYMLAGQAVRPRLKPTTYSAAVFFLASLTLMAIAIVQHAPLTGFPPRTWAMFALLAVVPTVGGHFLFNGLMRYVSAGMLSVSILGEPVGATLLAWWLLGQPLHPLQAVGGALTLASVAWFLFPALRDPGLTPAAAPDPPPTAPSTGR